MFVCYVSMLCSYCFFSADVDLSLPDVQLSPGHSADPSPSPEVPGPSTSSASKHHRAHRSGGARDERYRSGRVEKHTNTQVEVHSLECIISSNALLYSLNEFSHQNIPVFFFFIKIQCLIR